MSDAYTWIYLDADGAHVAAHRAQPRVQFDGGDGGGTVPEIDDDGRGLRAAQPPGLRPRQPPVLTAQPVGVGRAAGDGADGSGMHVANLPLPMSWTNPT